MFRLAGLLTGSAVATSLILLVLGIPERPPAEPTLIEPADEPAEAASPLLPPTPPAAQQAEEPLPEPVKTEPTEPRVPPATDASPVKWHAFWSPFGSRIAANGFVSRLESVTGFDYRVVKTDNGVFEVAFAYTTDNERDEILATIASASGLELPDS